ncbi:hypothetical protein IHE45_19G087800 [Dioscorea alata]|uniref:Uncharacterized protein n=2 Tax=Dioscorea alata TaxID=55571 RepID=A0ACB7TZQ3_DIOAL|nr:hypothetical protein IHE45_19G087800 [Dioscorea alata]
MYYKLNGIKRREIKHPRFVSKRKNKMKIFICTERDEYETTKMQITNYKFGKIEKTNERDGEDKKMDTRRGGGISVGSGDGGSSRGRLEGSG